LKVNVRFAPLCGPVRLTHFTANLVSKTFAPRALAIAGMRPFSFIAE
jgi:hypothetical protein